MLNFEWFCVMWICALQWITTSSFGYSRTAVWLHWVMQMLSPDRLCVFTVREWRLWIFSTDDSTKVSSLFSSEHTLANWRLNPLNLDKERNYCNVNTSNTIPCFAPGTLLVAQLSKFKYARTSSEERLPSSFLCLNCWALIKIHFFRKVLTRAGGGFRGLFGWTAYVRPQFASSFTS